MREDRSERERQRAYLAKDRELVLALSGQKGQPATFHVTTFGCQMNERDSEKLRGILAAAGYEEAPSEAADLVIYNTCTVRENADKRVLGRLGCLLGEKKKNPAMKIALCGCMAQEAHIVEKIKKSYPFVDLIFGTHSLYAFPELLHRLLTEEKRVIDVRPESETVIEDVPVSRTYPFKSGVNIMYGCNNFCTYCIVPYVRGRERSREKDEILSEIRRLASEGVVEIMLLGQNVNSYGRGLKEPVSFAGLLSEAAQIPGIRRVRFMTSHPKDLSDEVLKVMAEHPNICRHIHLPVQSGSTEILLRMNRHYTRERYLALVSQIRASLPEVSLTTDVIVGFPGETEEDFADTLSLIEECRFDSVFTFAYSKRTGTPAADMPHQVPQEVVKERFARLLSLVGTVGRQASSRFFGSVQEVLVEETNREAGLVTGRMDSNLLVHFPGDSSLIGRFVRVRLTSCKGFYYLGEGIKE